MGAIIGGLVFGLTMVFVGFWVKDKYKMKVYPNVYMFLENIGGKTVEEMDEFLTKKENEINKEKIIFLWQNNTPKRWEVVPQMIDFSLDKNTTINEALTRGRTTRGWTNFLEIYQLIISPLSVRPTFNFNQDKLETIASEIAGEIDRPSQDALFEFKEGKVINFQVSKEGQGVDQTELRSLILLVLTGGPFQNPLIALDLPVKKLIPKIATVQTNRLGIRELLGEGESFFKDSIPSRVHNIILASSYLHGIVIPPGEIFSFAEKIGDISAETGYQQAYVIRERKTVLEDGGGVCQVSTTLFRGALNAGLPIVERQPHYYRVGFYEQGGYPPGLDATVYPPSPDFKFKNDTSAYVLIQTRIDKERKRLAFELYGTSDGRRVEVGKPIIHSQTPPPEPIYIDEPSLKVGVIKRIDTAHWGAKVSFKRKVWAADGSLKEEKEFWANYTPWSAVYQRGVGQ